MNSPRSSLSKRYSAALLGYLTCHEERILNRAYELGREAIARGLGVLDMARIQIQRIALDGVIHRFGDTGIETLGADME